MQAPVEFFQGLRCSDFLWELVPVEDSPGEEDALWKRPQTNLAARHCTF